MGAPANAVIAEELADVARAWRVAPHGRKGEILAGAAARLQMSQARLYRLLGDLVTKPTRKRRSDAGKTALPVQEAQMIAAVLLEHMRKNGKMLKSVEAAVEVLRANNMIEALRINPATGEVSPLSISTIRKALRNYRLHPEQLLAPAPAMSLRSLHPNHVWQIDASRCVLFYLPRASKGDNGLRIMDHTDFYKNKPANVIKVINESLWRYVVTDHTSGWNYSTYVTGGENATNLVDVLIDAMHRREGEAMFGVPLMVMLDPGSANTSAIFKNLCKALRIHVQINKPKNPRAKGQVEKGQDLTERDFESTLRLLPADKVDSLEKINALVARWRRYFNGTRIHTRTGRTRDSAWLHITPEQLVTPPAAELLRSLALSAPESRVVSTHLRISYRGSDYDVSSVPGVCVGEKLQVCENPWAQDTVQVVMGDDEGHEAYQVVQRVTYDQFGMVADAPVIGESYARHADTPAQTNAKALELMATGTSTETEAKAARKAGTVAFGGQIDPFAHIDQALEHVPATMPRRGRDHDLVAPTVQLPPLSHIQAAKQLKQLFADWSPDYYARLQALYPDGVPADAIDAAAQALRAATAPAPTQSPIVQIVRAA
ncbi:DDE-type integrase/transposase/recombinase [Achromobacter xylosoxidans]